ncbi:uncharacterized protein LOC141664443 isoform X1 [Apium graveolens]|uniref:uncharacterized protein LOC141664443 isoform X1 n=1 Tax=Apium graveolens TaxID=4045 RepID=UPI003D78E627
MSDNSEHYVHGPLHLYSPMVDPQLVDPVVPAPIPAVGPIIPIVSAVPLRAIPPQPHQVRPPVRGPPPGDTSSTDHSVARTPPHPVPGPVPYRVYEAIVRERDDLLGQLREMEHVMRTTDRAQVERDLREKILISRMVARATLHVDIDDFDHLREWAKYVMRELQEIGGSEFP